MSLSLLLTASPKVKKLIPIIKVNNHTGIEHPISCTRGKYAIPIDDRGKHDIPIDKRGKHDIQCLNIFRFPNLTKVK